MEPKNFKLFDSDQYRNIIRGIRLANYTLPEEIPLSSDELTNRTDELTISDKLFCSFCNTKFENQFEQRTHYKLDWHRFNLKQKLVGLKSITQEKFSQLADNEDDLSSISGSESSPDEEAETSETESKSPSHHPMRHMKVFFQNDEGVVFSIYRCLLHSKKNPPEKEEDLGKLAMALAWKANWAVIMLTGGHFAAAIFKGLEPVFHKTFHSYIVRAGRGTTQSSKDQRGGCNKSAGSSLRRYNEACLTQRVQDLLNSWKENLTKCSLILVRAAGTSSKTIFYGKDAPLDRNDFRIRKIPIPTRRATYKEVKRVHSTLASIQIYDSLDIMLEKRYQQSQNSLGKNNKSENPQPRTKNKPDRGKERKSPVRNLPEIVTNLATKSTTTESDDEREQRMIEMDIEISMLDELQEFQDDVPKEQKNKKQKKMKKKKNKESEQNPSSNKENKEKTKPLQQKPELSPSNQLLYGNLIEICKSGDIVSLNSLLDSTSEQNIAEILNYPDNDGSTVLHLVANLGHDPLISILLERGADPAITNAKGKPPYAVAVNKQVRFAFRRFQALEPERYLYSKAQIPGPLTPEMEQMMADKAKEQRRIKKKKEKEKDRQMKEETDKERFLRLSDREKCALAAERRLMQLQSKGGGPAAHLVLSRCFQCGVNITGQVPFEYNNNRFCTIECLKKHRKGIAATAPHNSNFPSMKL